MGLNKKEIYERVRDALGVKNLTEVAERLGLTTGAVSQWKTTGKISLDTLIKVSELSGVSIHWLVTGKGEKKIKQPSPPLALVPFSADTPQVQAPNASILPAFDNITLTVVGNLKSNQQRLTIHEEVFSMQVPAILANGDSSVITIEGDMVKGEGLKDRDLLIVEPANGSTDGRIVVATIPGGRCLVRRITRAGQMVQLAPIEGDGPAIRFPAEDVSVLFVVTSITHQY